MKIELLNGQYILKDEVSWKEEQEGELKEVFRDGKLLINQSLSEIRSQVKSELQLSL
jgi:nicotinamide phosphoribosyltransferase